MTRWLEAVGPKRDKIDDKKKKDGADGEDSNFSHLARQNLNLVCFYQFQPRPIQGSKQQRQPEPGVLENGVDDGFSNPRTPGYTIHGSNQLSYATLLPITITAYRSLQDPDRSAMYAGRDSNPRPRLKGGWLLFTELRRLCTVQHPWELTEHAQISSKMQVIKRSLVAFKPLDAVFVKRERN